MNKVSLLRLAAGDCTDVHAGDVLRVCADGELVVVRAFWRPYMLVERQHNHTLHAGSLAHRTLQLVGRPNEVHPVPALLTVEPISDLDLSVLDNGAVIV